MSELGNHILIWPGCFRALAWTFTMERWDGSLLVLEPEKSRVMCWNLHAREERKGYFRELLQAIEADGLKTGHVSPNLQMEAILVHYGFSPHTETGPDGQPMEVWERPTKP
jgi:hypothetical protein